MSLEQQIFTNDPAGSDEPGVAVRESPVATVVGDSAGGDPQPDQATNTAQLKHLTAENRYLFLWNGTPVGLTDYRIGGECLYLTHTEIDPRRRGEGLGEAMIAAVLTDIRSETSLRIVPECSFVRHWMTRPPEE